MASGSSQSGSGSGPLPFVPTQQDINDLEALEKQAEELRKLNADLRGRFDEVLNSLSTSVPLLIGFAMVVPAVPVDNKSLSTTDPWTAMLLALIPVPGFVVGIILALHLARTKFKGLSTPLKSTKSRNGQIKKLLLAVQRGFANRGVTMPVPSDTQVSITVGSAPVVNNWVMNPVFYQRLVGVQYSVEELFGQKL